MLSPEDQSEAASASLSVGDGVLSADAAAARTRRVLVGFH